jgi:tetraacyldisaccharide 4'-kinase
MILERYIVDVMKGKRTGFFSSFLRGCLWLLSLPYRIAVKINNWAFDKDWLRQYHPPIPVVVSVGNIVVGGTGKTPVTLLLAKEFYDDAVVGILSRGYRSPAENLPSPVTLSSGKGPLHSAAYCGDEPYLMAENLPKAYIYVGKDRQKTAILAAKAGVEIAILDDGMQHRRIGRDYEIVVMDVEDPLGQNFHLPRGFLREDPKALSRADLVILNHVIEKAKFEECKKLVEKYTHAPIIGTELVLEKCFDLQKNEISGLKDKKGVIFCGIGQPDRFIHTVKKCGVNVIGQELFKDHAPFYSEQIIQLANKYKSQGADMLICTEKDKVKIPEIPGLSLPIVWLKMQLKVVENEEDWKKFVNKLRVDLMNRSQKESNLTRN